MLPLTRESGANKNSETNISLLATLALFLVVVCVLAMILAIMTVFQNGFQ